MEIISYFDSKSAFSISIDTPTLEEMLHKQRSVKKQIPFQKNTVSQKQESKKVQFSALNLLCIFAIQFRFALMAVCALTLIGLISVSVMVHVKSFATPLDFQQAVLMEEEVLKNSMQSFVSLSDAANIYEEEALALLADTNGESLYSQPVSFSTYTVQSGDSIHTISNKFGLENISTLIGINEIDNVRLLWAGQKLQVPSVDGLIYEVTQGDSLESIAKNYSVTIEEILDVNELDSSIIHIGDSLFIPGARMDTNSLRMAMGELFKFPLSSKGWRLSSSYGYRADPFTGVRSFHTGDDFAIAKGTPVRASMSGTVSVAGYSSIYGYYVIVNHGNGYQTLYAHFMEPSPVKKGQNVSQNTVIGYVGSTGYSTGNHLHFSVYKDGKLVNPRTIINY